MIDVVQHVVLPFMAGAVIAMAVIHLPAIILLAWRSLRGRRAVDLPRGVNYSDLRLKQETKAKQTYQEFKVEKFKEVAASVDLPVDLRLCWQWTCPCCGHTNHHLGHKMKPEDMEGMEAVDEHGNTLTHDDFVAEPIEVWCRKCEGKFPVKDEP